MNTRRYTQGLLFVGLLLALLTQVWGEKLVMTPKVPEQLEAINCSVLVLTPSVGIGISNALAALLEERFGVTAEVREASAYQDLVDEYSYAGFIYMGIDYDAPPTPGLLEDIMRTSKPVLWVHYHAWLLDKEYLLQHGLVIRDESSDRYTTVINNRVQRLTYSDTTALETDPGQVNYWLTDATRMETRPASVSHGAFTYISYTPAFTGDAADLQMIVPDLARFVAPMRKGCGHWPSYAERVEAAKSDTYRTGVHLPIYLADSSHGGVGYDSEWLHESLLVIKNSGAEWVTLSQIYYQQGTHASEFFDDPQLTPTLGSLANITEDAHRLNLLVRLSPIINLTEASRVGDDWRGFIRPDNPEKWWQQYRQMILDTTRFAEKNDIEAINIGAELNAMQVDASQWRDLIQAIREETGFTGLIGYQVNFDALEMLSWGDALDYVAIAAYWPLAGDRDPELSELMDSWQRIDQELSQWRKKNNIVSLEFGEIGYASQPYAGVLPYSWKPHKGGAVSLSEQAVCYQSLKDYLAASQVVNGVHVFAMFDEGPEGNGYMPFNKPANAFVEQILRLR